MEYQDGVLLQLWLIQLNLLQQFKSAQTLAGPQLPPHLLLEVQWFLVSLQVS